MRRGPNRDAYIGFVTLLIITALVLLSCAEQARAFGRYSVIDSAASWIAMRKVHVRCLTVKEAIADPVISWGASAYVPGIMDDESVWHPANYTVFAPRICEPIMALWRGDASDYTVEEISEALLILTHESYHLRGHRYAGSESLVQCRAIRHVGYMAERFEAKGRTVQLIVGFALQSHLKLPPQYHLPGCVLPGRPW